MAEGDLLVLTGGILNWDSGFNSWKADTKQKESKLSEDSLFKNGDASKNSVDFNRDIDVGHEKVEERYVGKIHHISRYDSDEPNKSRIPKSFDYEPKYFEIIQKPVLSIEHNFYPKTTTTASPKKVFKDEDKFNEHLFHKHRPKESFEESVYGNAVPKSAGLFVEPLMQNFFDHLKPSTIMRTDRIFLH